MIVANNHLSSKNLQPLAFNTVSGYKKGIFRMFLCQMDSTYLEDAGHTSQIASISDLCAALSISYSNLSICCNYCGITLSPIECVFFDHSECKLLWKDSIPRAVCHYCLKLLARFEFICFYKATHSAQYAAAHITKPFTEISIRCVVCLRRLQKEEVLQILKEDKKVFVIGNKLRTKCHLCEIGLI